MRRSELKIWCHWKGRATFAPNPGTDPNQLLFNKEEKISRRSAHTPPLLHLVRVTVSAHCLIFKALLAKICYFFYSFYRSNEFTITGSSLGNWENNSPTSRCEMWPAASCWLRTPLTQFLWKTEFTSWNGHYHSKLRSSISYMF